MSPSVLCLILIAQTGGAASQPATPVATTGQLEDLSGQVTIIHELGDKELKTQESWTIVNASPGAVSPTGLRIEMPGVRLMRLDEDVTSFVATEDRQAIVAKNAIPNGQTGFGAAYIMDTEGSGVFYERRFPIEIPNLRVVLEDVPGLSIESNIKANRRDRDLNGIRFAIWDFEPIAANQTVRVDIRGLPYKPVWPSRLAVVLGFLVAFWALWSIRTGSAAPGGAERQALGPLSAKARQERILKALELLEEDLAAEKLSDKRYVRRREALTKELAVVLRELDLETRVREG